ncbi:hypothetical protein AB7092_15455 [Providencia rettgeri]|uniref:hypothetical protein n=1 Tax=Providencia TaxID=586 RepID=UPI000F7B1564|nr:MULTISPECIES: hypothetical protein [unclassified Providencia]ELR5076114.1 hypothetical protein [Providencia stuartii]MBV2188044.1 hypothetical protein [Providencia rettgeri]WOB91790.1 hypothetical protein P3L44_04200 [Providencia sp. PROV175]WOC00504.1 hypothetical protein P3L55_04055 [Providencia sp. PROV046]
MKSIGFMGGSSIFETGTVQEMIDFFDYLSGENIPDLEKELIDSLYRKYIRYQDLDRFENLITELKKSSSSESKYLKYFDAIITCIESAKMFYNSWEIYQPLKVGFTDMPYCIDDKDRPQELYDALTEDDLPFWLR